MSLVVYHTAGDQTRRKFVGGIVIAKAVYASLLRLAVSSGLFVLITCGLYAEKRIIGILKISVDKSGIL
jgi:hypothetical protein